MDPFRQKLQLALDAYWFVESMSDVQTIAKETGISTDALIAIGGACNVFNELFVDLVVVAHPTDIETMIGAVRKASQRKTGFEAQCDALSVNLEIRICRELAAWLETPFPRKLDKDLDKSLLAKTYPQQYVLALTLDWITQNGTRQEICERFAIEAPKAYSLVTKTKNNLGS